jgi:NADH-quinone oxidoreductase subunit A
MPSSIDPAVLAGFVALFVAIGGAFLAVNLLVGWLVRPRVPNAEKLEVYECGEPTIGSSFVQFDLRFYVVALLFIIFDVEVALFFPWATVFGKATQLADPALVTVEADGSTLTPAAAGLIRELGLSKPAIPDFSGVPASPDREPRVPSRLDSAADVSRAGSILARLAAADMATFFAVLLVGFAYVWSRGDLDWVRATSAGRGAKE